jgi:hypothetical protein
MRTEDLVAALASHVEPVDAHAPTRRLWWATAAGIGLGMPLMLAAFGLNPKLAEAAQIPMFWVKVTFVTAMAAAGWWFVFRLARPGAALHGPLLVLSLPVAAIWLLAAFVLLSTEPAQRSALIMGSTWASCPWNIALLSVPALVAVFLAVHTLAPTRLRLAGAGAGLLAGALGAFAYLLHCPELAAPFLAIWYVLGMLVPAAVGALVGPRVLRW